MRLVARAGLSRRPDDFHGSALPISPVGAYDFPNFKNPGTDGFERHARAGVRGSWNSSASGVLTESEFERYRNSQRVEKYISISVG